jgi:hypothetical protein
VGVAEPVNLRKPIWNLGLILLTATAVHSLQALPTVAADTPVSAAPAARVRIQDVWQQIYQKLPNLPLENQYVNREIGKVDPNNTLVSRLIRYHYYIKGRPVNYRLDWKMTLADYLGINEPIEPTTYPGADNLRNNPYDRDRSVIAKLDRKQRDALVQALVDIFNPSTRASAPAPSKPVPALRPRSGGAELLK